MSSRASFFYEKSIVRKAVLGMVAMKRLSMLTTATNVDAHKLASDVRQYKEDSEKVSFTTTEILHIFWSFTFFQEHVDEDKSIVHHHNVNGDGEDSEEEQRLKATDDISTDSVKNSSGPLVDALANTSISQKQIPVEKTSEYIDRTGLWICLFLTGIGWKDSHPTCDL